MLIEAKNSEKISSRPSMKEIDTPYITDRQGIRVGAIPHDERSQHLPDPSTQFQEAAQTACLDVAYKYPDNKPLLSCRKRKRTQSEGRPCQNQEYLDVGRAVSSPGVATTADTIKGGQNHPVWEAKARAIHFWVLSGRWPRILFEANSACIEPRRPPDTEGSSEIGTLGSKDAWYASVGYLEALKCLGVVMDPIFDMNEASRAICETLLAAPQTVPQDSLFSEEFFERTCKDIVGKNEPRLVHYLMSLIVAPAEELSLRGDIDLENLAAAYSEEWNRIAPLTDRRPQPNYSVGFKLDAFFPHHLGKIHHLCGTPMRSRTSYFRATNDMYFPFLTTETKLSGKLLDIADRQNMQSGACTTRAVVELYRLLGRQKELDREVLAFSISHSIMEVRIYGYFAVSTVGQTVYFRELVREFDFTDPEDKWTAYRFTKNLYQIWAPRQLERIKSALDELPESMSLASLTGGYLSP